MQEAKNQVRATLQQRRNGLSAETRTATSAEVCTRLQSLPELNTACAIAGYVPLADEVDVISVLEACLRHNVLVFLPRFVRGKNAYEMVSVKDVQLDVMPGEFGIPEPRPEFPAVPRTRVAARDVAWLVPGVAFDRRCNRLGRGGGFYDRLLQDTEGQRIGVAFDWQIVAALPHGPTDIPMDIVQSELRVLRRDADTEPGNP